MLKPINKQRHKGYTRMQSGMNQTFLIINSNKASAEKFATTLKTALPRARIIVVANIDKALVTVRTIEFTMVFINVVNSTSVSMIDKLKSNSALKFTPVVLTGEDIEQDTLIKKFNMLHINGFLNCNFSEDDIKLTIRRLLPLTSLQNKTDTIMTNMIRAMLRKVGAQEHSLSMVTKALILCRLYQLDRNETFACVSALKYLSISATTNESFKNALSFFLELGFNNRTSALMREMEFPISLASKIAHSIYAAMLHVNQYGNMDEWRCKTVADTTVASNTKYLYNGYAVFLQSGYDVEMIVERAMRLLISYDIGKTISKDFLNLITLFLTKVLLFKNGGIVVTQSTASRITLSIEPMIFNEEELSEDVCELSVHGVEAKMDQKIKKIHISLPCQQSDAEVGKEVPEFEEMFLDFADTKEDTLVSTTSDISAQEFFKTNTIGMNELAELGSTQDELLETCQEFETTSDLRAKVVRAVKHVRKYAAILTLAEEFNNLSQTLMYFGAVLHNNLNDDTNHDKVLIVSKLLTFLTDDLITFRRSVFIDKTAENIHFMDLSIISSCHQAIDMFFEKNENDNESSIFF